MQEQDRFAMGTDPGLAVTQDTASACSGVRPAGGGIGGNSGCALKSGSEPW